MFIQSEHSNSGQNFNICLKLQCKLSTVFKNETRSVNDNVGCISIIWQKIKKYFFPKTYLRNKKNEQGCDKTNRTNIISTMFERFTR